MTPETIDILLNSDFKAIALALFVIGAVAIRFIVIYPKG